MKHRKNKHRKADLFEVSQSEALRDLVLKIAEKLTFAKNRTPEEKALHNTRPGGRSLSKHLHQVAHRNASVKVVEPMRLLPRKLN